jgi:serine/threonine-protein kinase RsbW
MPRNRNKDASRPRRSPRALEATPGRLVFSDAIPSQTSALEPLIGRVMTAVEHCGWMDGEHAAVELALREALANAVLHGNRQDPAKRVEVDCFRQRDDSLLLVVRDQGHGFDPHQLDDPTKPENIYRAGGRGIFLIRHFMDAVEFRRANGRGCEIRMCKRRDSNGSSA